MGLSEDQQAAEMAFELATKKLKLSKGKTGPGAEATYNMAYKRLVALGLRSKLRGRYNT